jgi:chitodextrinase
MKNSNKFWLSLFVFIALCNITIAQTSLGSSKNFLNNLKKDLTNSSAKGSSAMISLKVADGAKNFEGKVNYKKSDAISELLMGEIKNIPQSSFYLKVIDKVVEGHILFLAKKEAYKYYSDEQGNVYISKVDINTIVCIDYKNAPQNKKETNKNPTQMKIAPAMLNLQSLPGAAGCVMLDFDGYYMPAGNSWNNGNPINAAPSGISDAALLEQWEVVAEDYRPFNVNITTNEAVFNSYPKTRRMRAVITPTDTAAPGWGGVAWVGSFNWDNDVPCWVFALGGKYGGEATSHEIGHTFDLLHDGRNTTPKELYFNGLPGTPWAPIMGTGYSNPVSQWSKGEYNIADNKQDDLAIISSAKFGVGYRADDYGNTTASAAILTSNTSGTINQKSGVITNEADIDFFTFTTGGGNVTLNTNTVSRHGDLDIVIRLYNASGAQIASNTNTTAGVLSASLASNLAAGKYFLSVDGTGAGNPASGGYSAYASIGSYYITGTIPPGGGGGDTQAPTAPSGLVASGTTASSTNLAWNASTDNVGVTGYDVYRGTTLITTVTGRTYTASGLSASTAYSFSVRAKDAAGNISAASNTVNVTTSAGGGGGLPFNSGDVFTLTAKHSDKYMTVNGASQANGGTIDQWTKSVPTKTNQQFKFIHVADGYYQLQAMNSGKCADVAGLSLDNGAKIQQWDCSSAANQLWKFESQADGTYMIISKLSGRALDIESASLTDGAKLQQWSAYGGDNQKWWINPVTTGISSGIVILNSDESEISIYPNPFENEFNFSTSEKVLPSNVLLYDVQGKKQTMSIENINNNNNTYKVNANGLPSGIYILKITTATDSKAIKIVKQ